MNQQVTRNERSIPRAVSELDGLEALRATYYAVATSYDSRVASSGSPLYESTRNAFIGAARAMFGPKVADVLYALCLDNGSGVQWNLQLIADKSFARDLSYRYAWRVTPEQRAKVQRVLNAHEARVLESARNGESD